MKVAIVDYGMGNLGSVRRALSVLGADAAIVAGPEQLQTFDRVILPGVGSFADGMSNLNRYGWSEEIRRQSRDVGKPLLGICLGMQLLATRGTEGSDGGTIPGLGLIEGEVVHLAQLGCTSRVPHVGWNSVAHAGESALFSGIPAGTDFYFVHSFAFCPANREHISATTDYTLPVVAAVGSAHIMGTQFHPEKSSKAGFRVLHNFLDLKKC